MGKFEGTNYLDFKAELMKDPEFRKKYEELQPKYDRIAEKIRAEIERDTKSWKQKVK